MTIREDRNHVVYEKVLKSLGGVVYVGEGDLSRANEPHRSNDEFNSLVDAGLIETVIVKTGLTKGQAETYESILIEKYGIDNLYNNQKGRSSINSGDIDRDTNTTDVIKDAINFAFDEHKAVDTITPRNIVNEIIDNMICTPNFDPSKMKYLNPVARLGEFFKYITDKLGVDTIKGNYTMINESVERSSMFFLSDNSNGAKMQDVKIINEDFDVFDTDERYDVIIMNPPFVKKGEKFIIKCMDLLKDGGYLGCVMSPTWRSITTKLRNKAYHKMLKSGGFHMIHMYSVKDTTESFGRNIGQVDTFVWQKGVDINNTKIINQNGDEYHTDLSKYPQTPPVLPSYIYDRYFDQVNGLKWFWFGHPRDSYGPVTNTFVDCITGKEFKCNDANVEKTQGKKIFVDPLFNNYVIDNKGNKVCNYNRIFFFDTDKERDDIINTLNFIVDNNYKDLFVTLVGRTANTFIPGIRVSNE